MPRLLSILAGPDASGSAAPALPVPSLPAAPPAVMDLAYKRQLVRRLDPARAWVEATDGERALARESERYVREVDALVARGLTYGEAAYAAAAHPEWYPALIADGVQLSLRNYRYWRDRLRAGGNKSQALLRNYRAGVARRELAQEWFPEFAQILSQQFFSRNGLDPAQAWRNACIVARGTHALAPEQIPSRPQAARYLRKAVGERLAMMMRDPKRYADQLSGYFMLNWDCEPGTVWIGDHRILDIFVRVWIEEEQRWVPMRPYCTCWMDAKSGYLLSVLIYVDSAPNHAKILEALYLAIRANGMMPPFVLVTDNGKDYLKAGALRDLALQTMDEPTRGANGRKTLVEEPFEDLVLADGQEYRHSIARALGCNQKRTAPYKGRQKPIERVFRNFARQFDRTYYGYCGTNRGQGPAGDEDFRGNVMRLITAPQLVEQFRAWLPDGYHRAPTESRRTGGETPETVWASRRPWRTPLTEDELNWAMLLPHARALDVRAGPTGSNVWFRGWPYEGVGDADVVTLGDLHGRQVMVKTSWSPAIPNVPHGKERLPGRIYLFSPDGRYLCEAEPAMERDVFGTSSAQRERISQTCRKIAVLRRADREAREALAGTGRIYAPAHALGLQNLSGPVPPITLPPAPASGGDAESARDGFSAVAASQTAPTGRGRAGRQADSPADAPGPDAPGPDAPAAPPAAAAAFREFLARESGESQTSGPAPDLAGFARFQSEQGGGDA